MKQSIVVFALSWCLASAVQCAEIGPLELEDWGDQLRKEGWQPLFAGKNQPAIGMFMVDTNSTEAIDTQAALAQCGISLVSRTRTRFSSPPVPAELKISTSKSKSMVQSLTPIFSKTGFDHISIKILNPRWARLMSSDSTSLIHASAIWSNPATRGPIVQCVTEKLKHPLIESVLQADIVIAAKDAEDKNISVDNEVTSLSAHNFLNGALKSTAHSYSIAGTTLARRTGLCVNSLLFFRNSKGDVGGEDCSN
jgi:hypothetical protein